MAIPWANLRTRWECLETEPCGAWQGLAQLVVRAVVGAAKVRRFYAQSTPFRVGRRPDLMPRWTGVLDLAAPEPPAPAELAPLVALQVPRPALAEFSANRGAGLESLPGQFSVLLPTACLVIEQVVRQDLPGREDLVGPVMGPVPFAPGRVVEAGTSLHRMALAPAELAGGAVRAPDSGFERQTPTIAEAGRLQIPWVAPADTGPEFRRCSGGPSFDVQAVKLPNSSRIVVGDWRMPEMRHGVDVVVEPRSAPPVAVGAEGEIAAPIVARIPQIALRPSTVGVMPSDQVEYTVPAPFGAGNLRAEVQADVQSMESVRAQPLPPVCRLGLDTTVAPSVPAKGAFGVSADEVKPTAAFPLGTGTLATKKRYAPVMIPARFAAKSASTEARRDAPPMAGLRRSAPIDPVATAATVRSGDPTAVATSNRRRETALRLPIGPKPCFRETALPAVDPVPQKRAPARAGGDIAARLGLDVELASPRADSWHLAAFRQAIASRWVSAPLAAKWGAAVAALVLAGFALPLPGGHPKRPGPVQSNAATSVVGLEKASGQQAEPRAPVRGPARAAPPLKNSRKKATGQSFFGAVGASWRGFKSGLSDRAAFSVSDDFRAGLGEWSGEGDWARSWAYDQAGFIRPGQLALLDSSLWLADYQVEFVGQIDRRGLGWVVRASDFRNYHAVRLVVVEEGPLPKVMLERYAVVGGRTGAVQRTLLPFPVRNETSYHVVTQVRGDTYAVSVQDRVVATWSESRLATGGAGFFSGKNERARIRWIQIRRNDDLLGKICALVARPGRGRESGDNEEISE